MTALVGVAKRRRLRNIIHVEMVGPKAPNRQPGVRRVGFVINVQGQT